MLLSATAFPVRNLWSNHPVWWLLVTADRPAVWPPVACQIYYVAPSSLTLYSLQYLDGLWVFRVCSLVCLLVTVNSPVVIIPVSSMCAKSSLEQQRSERPLKTFGSLRPSQGGLQCPSLPNHCVRDQIVFIYISKNSICNSVNVEVDVRTQRPSFKPRIKEICKNVKHQSSHSIFWMV